MAAPDEVLLTAWRSTRDPRLAEELRRRLGLRVRRAPRTGDLEGAWSKAVRERHFQELLELLLCGSLAGAAQKVRALGALDDPRVCSVLQPVLVALGPEARAELMPVIIEVIGQSRDVGARWYLEQFDDDEPERVAAALKELEKVVVETRADLSAVVNPKPPREEELLAAVHAAPDDAGARAVYGDALLERGDPRGELFALQLGPNAGSVASRRQAAALVASHFRDWVFPLQLNQSAMEGSKLEVFERGFLTAAVVDRLAGQEQFREWGTVEHLFADRMRENQPAMLSVAKSSKALKSLFWLELETAAKLKSPRLERVGLWARGDLERKHLAGLSGLKALWLMPSLGFKQAELPWQQLEQLFIYEGGTSWEAWRKNVLAQRGPGLNHVSFLDSQAWMPQIKGWQLRFRLEEDPKLERPELIWHGGRQLQRELAGLSPALCKSLKAVTVRAPEELVSLELKHRLGPKLEMGPALTKKWLNTDPFTRLADS